MVFPLGLGTDGFPLGLGTDGFPLGLGTAVDDEPTRLSYTRYYMYAQLVSRTLVAGAR